MFCGQFVLKYILNFSYKEKFSYYTSQRSGHALYDCSLEKIQVFYPINTGKVCFVYQFTDNSYFQHNMFYLWVRWTAFVCIRLTFNNLVNKVYKKTNYLNSTFGIKLGLFKAFNLITQRAVKFPKHLQEFYN